MCSEIATEQFVTLAQPGQIGINSRQRLRIFRGLTRISVLKRPRIWATEGFDEIDTLKGAKKTLTKDGKFIEKRAKNHSENAHSVIKSHMQSKE